MRLIKWLFYSLLVALVFISLTPFVGKWYLKQKLEEKGYQVEINDLAINLLTGSIRLGGVNLTDSKGSRLNANSLDANVDIIALVRGDITLESVAINDAVVDVQTVNGELELGGFSQRDLNAVLGESFDIKLGRVEIEGSEVCIGPQRHCLHVESLITGRANLNYSDKGWTFSHHSSLSVNKVFLRDLSGGVAALYLDKLDILSAEYSRLRTQLTGVKLKNFQFAESLSGDSVQAVFLLQTQIGEMNISRFQYNNGERKELMVGDISLVSPRQSVIKKRGRVQVPFGSEETMLTFYNTAIKTFLGRGDLHFSMQKLSVQGGIASWRDNLVEPPVHEQLTAIQFQLGQLDNNKTASLAGLKFSAKLGGRGLLSFDGTTYPMGPMPAVKGAVKIQEWDLSNITAYTPMLFNHKVREGIIDLAFDVNLQNQQLQLTSDWLLSDLVLDKTEADSSFNKSLRLLRDRNQSVRFSLPMTRNLTVDKVTLNTIFGDLVVNKLRAVSQGQLGDDAAPDKVKDFVLGSSRRASKMEYRSILYQANSREPEQVDKRRLWDIAEILKSKPLLNIAFCPVSTADEWAEVFNNGVGPGEGFTLLDHERQKLTELAIARTKYLRQELLDQGVERSQVTLCEPTIDMTRSGLPYVTISM